MTAIHALRPLPPMITYSAKRATLCGVECWPCETISNEADTSAGRLELVGGTNHKTTCKRCLKKEIAMELFRRRGAALRRADRAP
jgi:hypothetical protein